MALLTQTTAALTTPNLVVPTLAAIAGYSISLGLVNTSRGRTRTNFPVAFGRKRLQICRSASVQSFGPSVPLKSTSRSFPALTICLAALDAKCSAVQTLPHTGKSKSQTTVTVPGTVKKPDLDNGGPAVPPNDGDDDGDDNESRGGDSSGGWFLFGILFLLISEGAREEGRRRTRK